MSNTYSKSQEITPPRTRSGRRYNPIMAPSHEEPSDLALTPTTLVPLSFPRQMAGPSDERYAQTCHHCEYCSASAQVADEPQPTFYLPHCHEVVSDPRYHTENMAPCMNAVAHPTAYEVCSGCHDDTTLSMSEYVVTARRAMQLPVCVVCAQRALYVKASTGTLIRGCQCSEDIDREWYCSNCRSAKWQAKMEAHNFRVMTLTLMDGGVKCPCEERLPSPESMVTLCSQCNEISAVERK